MVLLCNYMSCATFWVGSVNIRNLISDWTSADLTLRSPPRAWLFLDFPSCPLKFVPLQKLQGWCFHSFSFSGVHSNINLLNRKDFNSEDFLTQSESVGAFSPWQFGSFPVLMPQDLVLSPDLHPRLLCCLQPLKLVRKLLSHDVQVSFKHNLFAVCRLRSVVMLQRSEGLPLSCKSSSCSENSPEIFWFLSISSQNFSEFISLFIWCIQYVNISLFVLLVPTDLL